MSGMVAALAAHEPKKLDRLKPRRAGAVAASGMIAIPKRTRGD